MWLEYINIARKVLVAHKFRSLLTVLSITIGAFSIVLMTSLAQSGSRSLFRDIEELGGARQVMIFGKEIERAENKSLSYTRGLTRQDADAVFNAVPHLDGHTMFARLQRTDIITDNGRFAHLEIFAVDGDWFDIEALQPGAGRFFDQGDNLAHHNQCVIGAHTARDLFDGEAIGHTMQIGSLRCRVVGQASAKDFVGNFGFDRMNFIAVPWETLNDLEIKVRPSTRLLLRADRPESNEIVKRVANAVLTERHRGVDDFIIVDFGSIMAQFAKFFRIMGIIAGFIAGIALLVGGVGVMNMMLVSVSERVKEIGIRKAIGASPSDIGRQFLLESMVLAGSGGLIGASTGVAAAYGACALIRHFKPRWLTVIADDSVVIAIVVSIAIGLLFGYFPARRASRLDAITAIRGTN